VRLLIDETFATGTYTVPIASGWIAPPDGLAVEFVPELGVEALGEGDAVLAPSSALVTLHNTHLVIPGVAVVSDNVGLAAMRTPARPDEIEPTPVRLLASGVTELLARATLRSFYGITATSWILGDEPGAELAQVVIVGGAEALREPEGGFSEDLSRAWFILTAQPVVSHLLLVPREIADEDRQRITDFLDAARTEGLARRREWRPALAEREGIISARSGAFWSAQRLRLEDADRPALFALLRNGIPGTSGSSLSNVQFIDGSGAM
jgi:hypothetical protein